MQYENVVQRKNIFYSPLDGVEYYFGNKDKKVSMKNYI